MNSKLPVLEYSVAEGKRGKRGKWLFRFRTSEGEVLIQSSMKFPSKAEAERRFVSLIKSIASNEYQVAYLQQPLAGTRSFRDLNPRDALKSRKRIARRW